MLKRLSKLKLWLAGAGAFLATLFYAKYQKQKADALEGAVEALEEEISFKESVQTAKEEVLQKRHSRRSEIKKELKNAKEKILEGKDDLAYPDGKLDVDLIRVLNKGRTEK